jgi:glucose/arabinose dehydrogenase
MKGFRGLVHAALLFALPVGGLVVNLSVGSSRPAQAQGTIQLEPIVGGLSAPVFVTNAHDGSNRIFIVEQPGTIKVLQPGSTTPTVFLNITSSVLYDGGERGLLGMAFHPFYQNTGRFFVYYTRQPDGMIVIAEYHVSIANANVADPTESTLLTIPHSAAANHNGGMLAFGPDGYLYAGPGDGGSANDPPNNAQTPTVLLGKILRIDVDHQNPPALYSSPPSNPFFGSETVRNEIYSLGMRNPFRFSFDPSTGALYVADVGQNLWEEIDIVTSGQNYGWRVFEGMHCTGNDPNLCNAMSPCNILGFTCPIVEYFHSVGRCAIIGGYVYRGVRSTFPQGTYVYGDLCTSEIFTLSGLTQNTVATAGTSISSFGVDEFGEIYVVQLGTGSFSRLVNSAAPCSVTPLLANQSFSSDGGSSIVSVAATGSCAWNASKTGTFIHINSGSNGMGYGVVSFSVDANMSATPRSGSITVASTNLDILQGAQFSDVSPASPFAQFIGKLSSRGVTVGCDAGKYCPSDHVTRGQMAAFIIRALGDFNPPPPPSQRFLDVPPSNYFYAFIDELAARGITVGCGGGNFCPDDFVTREQMSAFVMRGLGVTNPPSPLWQRFSDVPSTNIFYGFIDQMALRGITLGCGGNNYCPADMVTRDQMAAFLVRAFGL